MNIHPDFKNKNILQYIADLIINYEYDHYLDLSDADKEGLVALLIAANPTETDFITDTQTIAYFCKSLSGTSNDDENFYTFSKQNQSIITIKQWNYFLSTSMTIINRHVMSG